MGTYAVMLPLRLETRFIPPGMSAERPEEPDPGEPEWRLRLRVMPDRASITTERFEPTPPELVALQSLWDTLSKDPEFPDPLPADPDLRLDTVVALAGWTDAFARLAAVTGPARARQLVGTVPAVGSPPRVPVAAAGENWVIPTVRGLPAALDVWVIWAGADPDAPVPQPEVIATLSPNKDLLSLSPLPESDDDSPEQRWWGSWASAVTAGLAEEIVLARDPEEIEVLGVSGLGPGDGTTAAACSRRTGSPAISASFAPARPPPRSSDRHGGRRRHGRVGWPAQPRSTPCPGCSDRAGRRGGRPRRPTARRPRGLDAADRLCVLPALWGYGLQGVLGVLRDPRDPVHRPENAEWNLDLWGWAREWLRPEGRFPPVRIGRQAYGVLALAAPSDEVVDGLARAGGRLAAPLIETPLAVPLGRIARRWAMAAEQGLADGQPERALRSSQHGPVPARLRHQRLIPVVTDAIRLQEDALDALEHEWSDRAWIARILDQEDLGWRAHGRLYRTFGPSRPLRLPILGPGLDGGREPLDPDALDALLEPAIAAIAPIEELGFPGLLHRERAPESLLLTLYQRSVAVSSQLLWNADRTGAVDEADPILRLGLLEPLGAPFSETRASLQADRLAVAGEASDVRVPDFLPRAVDPGGVADLLEACAEEPALRPIANRAVRALADAAAGRWDAWLAGVGAAHATEAVAEGSTPVLGATAGSTPPTRMRPIAASRGQDRGDSVLPPRRRSPAPSRCCETGPSSTRGAGPCSTIRRSSAKRGGGWRILRSGGTPPSCSGATSSSASRRTPR